MSPLMHNGLALPMDVAAAGHTHHLPGVPASAATARFLVKKALGSGHPYLGDVLQVVSEMAANAVVHSRSGVRGAEFTLHIDVTAAAVRIEVTDAGPLRTRPTVPVVGRLVSDDEHGRGLALVEHSAHDWGTDVHPNGYRSVWASWGEAP